MNISEILKNYYNEIENDKSKIREIIAFCFFCAGTIFLSFFHEPWFDEFQAWGISKDSLYNILFVIPHNEGHPPLWYLILKCFTHFNLNPELCLKIPNLSIMFCSIWLLLFKSPFPRIVRITLPFTFFFFYQYSIISRPYSVFVLAMFLCAVFFKSKDTNPFRFVSALALLCLSSVYGMLFTVGFTVAWGLDFVDFKNLKSSLIDFFKTKQFKAMFLLFLFCVLLTIIIFPAPTNTAHPLLSNAPLYLKFLYCFCGIIADATIFDLLNASQTLYVAKYEFANFLNLYAGLIFGLFLNVFLIKMFTSVKRITFFIIPYLLFLLFAFVIYFYNHHEGTVFVFLIFVFWINYDVLKEKLSAKNKKILILLAALTICVQLSWSFCSYTNEYMYNYAPSREIANYIKKHKLDKYKIFSMWLEYVMYKDKNGEIYFNEDELIDGEEYEEILEINPECQWLSTIVSPYFDKHVIQNFNIDYPQKKYIPHIYRTPDEQTAIKQKWKKLGLPEVLIGKARLESVFDGIETEYNYFPIKTFYYDTVWKSNAPFSTINIYAHKNLYDEMKEFE